MMIDVKNGNCDFKLWIRDFKIDNWAWTLQGHGKHKGRHGKAGSSGKWQTRVHQIAAVLSKMDYASGQGGYEDPNDFRSCENLIEAYFMQVGVSYNKSIV